MMYATDLLTIKWVVVFTVVCLYLENAYCENQLMRKYNGDKFENRLGKKDDESCKEANARCDRDDFNQCVYCKCTKGNETYRVDLKKCVSSEDFSNFTGCNSRGKNKHSSGFQVSYTTDMHLPTLDLSKHGTKYIDDPFLQRIPPLLSIVCTLRNSSGLLNDQGSWQRLKTINDIFTLQPIIITLPDLPDRRLLELRWENVKKEFVGRIIKLDILCRTKDNGVDEGCFVFKSKGKPKLDKPVLTRTSTLATEEIATSSQKPKELPTIITQSTKNAQDTETDEADTFSVPMAVIIGAAVGIGIVILIIVILAVCFVRQRTRQQKQQRKTPPVSSDQPPKVHFTAQARFSLIENVVPIDDDDYTSLQAKRESFDPYCSLKKDDLDMNVIETILKDAVSMDSMNASRDPRYSYNLTRDDAVVIESAKPQLSPVQPNYHMLELHEDDRESDYEEVDDDNYSVITSWKETKKPPLPDRVYHELEPPAKSTC